MLSVLKGIGGICRQENIDIIQCPLSDAEFLGILAGRLNHVPRIITTAHYPDLLPKRTEFSLRNYLRAVSTRKLYRWTDSIVALSNEISGNIEKVFRISPEKIFIVPHSIDTKSFQLKKNISTDTIHLMLTADHRILCMVGHLMPPRDIRVCFRPLYHFAGSIRKSGFCWWETEI